MSDPAPVPAPEEENAADLRWDAPAVIISTSAPIGVCAYCSNNVVIRNRRTIEHQAPGQDHCAALMEPEPHGPATPADPGEAP
jgi:hypothetical protein